VPDLWIDISMSERKFVFLTQVVFTARVIFFSLALSGLCVEQVAFFVWFQAFCTLVYGFCDFEVGF
jgi:hypothetical protein